MCEGEGESQLLFKVKRQIGGQGDVVLQARKIEGE